METPASSDTTMQDAKPAEPAVKKIKCEEQMAATFMGDTGFDENDLPEWRTAEAKMGIVNRAAKIPKYPKAAPIPTPPSVDARFPPSRTNKCDLYRGRVEGYVFKLGDDGVGYYVDLPKRFYLTF